MTPVVLSDNHLTRFWSLVYPEPTTGCWLWGGRINTSGYGQFGHLSVHRVIYELTVGPIPFGLQLDHLCHTWNTSCPGGRTCPHRVCCNPDHLEPVTLQMNLSRGRHVGPPVENATKTHCAHGHEFTSANTYVYQSKEGRPKMMRTCRTCNARRVAQRKARLISEGCWPR